MPLASSVGKKPKKSTEDSVIYLLGNAQRDVGDWLTLINKLDTIGFHIYKRQPKINRDSGLERSAVWNAVLLELALQTCSSEFVLYFIFILFYFIFYFFIFYFLLIN